MTKRNNTGTGGIAYLDVLCSNSWGYAFGSALNNTTNFNFPQWGSKGIPRNPYFAHVLGFSLGYF